MLREFTCIICPNGCDITAHIEDGKVMDLEGALCPRGADYVTQELTDPQRNIASSVVVTGGALPLVSVRLTNAIAKARIGDMMEQIQALRLEAPVTAGQVLLHHPLGLDTDLITTKHVPAE